MLYITKKKSVIKLVINNNVQDRIIPVVKQPCPTPDWVTLLQIVALVSCWARAMAELSTQDVQHWETERWGKGKRVNIKQLFKTLWGSTWGKLRTNVWNPHLCVLHGKLWPGYFNGYCLLKLLFYFLDYQFYTKCNFHFLNIVELLHHAAISIQCDSGVWYRWNMAFIFIFFVWQVDRWG